MKKYFAAVMLCLTLAGCSGTTVGDGVFDAREQAYFKAGVGIAISAKPETAAPVYAVATTCLGLISLDLDLAMKLTDIDEKLRPSVADLINVLKADMETVIATEVVIDVNKRTEIIKQMLVIVQTSAKERM